MTRDTRAGKKTSGEEGMGVSPDARTDTAEYFNKLRLRLKPGLLAAFLLPIVSLQYQKHIHN
ncbi:MAG: hypothetical protein GY854_04385, partial [Deltaproteobacteria bacterium]|nr:hypothetical protein [Deltaproteobacteria bacterium]